MMQMNIERMINATGSLLIWLVMILAAVILAGLIIIVAKAISQGIKDMDRKGKMQITTLPKDDVKRGEIYYISRGGYNTGSEQQADRPGVIVSNDKNNKNSQTLEVVYLTTQPKNELPTHCTIRSTGRVSTVLCEQIHTVAVERIGKYIGVCTAQEMQNIDIGLMISIGLGDGGATKDKTVVADQKEEKKAEEKKTETKVQMETNEELIKARTERDIFKKLYEQMTERLLERRE